MKLSILLVGWLALAGADDYVVKSKANLVVLDVSVLGGDGQPVGGLGRDNFQIFENGKRQVIKQFSVAETPVSVGFVIDMSGSMKRKLEGVRRATSIFLDASNPKDEYFLIGFNDRPWVGLPTGMEFSINGDDIRKAFGKAHAIGKTALYDGVVLALKHAVLSRYERRVLVLISDGKDTASSLALTEALQAVRASAVTVYTIGLFSEDDEDSNRGVLRQLARVTGGRYYEPATPAAIDEASSAIARDLRARYTLAYTPPVEARSGVRKIKVELERPPGMGKANVRARSEYVLEEK